MSAKERPLLEDRTKITEPVMAICTGNRHCCISGCHHFDEHEWDENVCAGACYDGARCIKKRRRENKMTETANLEPEFIPDPKPGWRSSIQVTPEQVDKVEAKSVWETAPEQDARIRTQIKSSPTSEPAYGSTSIQFHKWIPAEPQIKIKLEKGMKNTYAWEITLEGLDTNQVIERIQQADKALHGLFGEPVLKQDFSKGE